MTSQFEIGCFYKFKGGVSVYKASNDKIETLEIDEVYKCVDLNLCSAILERSDGFKFNVMPQAIKCFIKSGITEKNWRKTMENIDEKVDHPSHYNKGGMEVIDQMIILFGLDKTIAFCELNAYKYRMRAGYKDDAAQDISKALWYENKAKELIKRIAPIKFK